MKDLASAAIVPVCLLAASCAGPGDSTGHKTTDKRQPALNLAAGPDARRFALPEGFSKVPEGAADETDPSARPLRIAAPGEHALPEVAEK